jgi:hypothetical protein
MSVFAVDGSWVIFFIGEREFLIGIFVGRIILGYPGT